MSAQNQQHAKDDRPGAPPPIYNPYPPGILPADLNSEIARVQREVDVIETEALQQWHALPPPILTGQPPTLQNTGVESIEILGKLMNFDKHISTFQNEACGFCHMPYAGFSGPIPSVSRVVSLSGGEADGTEIYVRALFSSSPIQLDARPLFWRKFLGFARNWLRAEKSGLGAGTAPPRR